MSEQPKRPVWLENKWTVFGGWDKTEARQWPSGAYRLINCYQILPNGKPEQEIGALFVSDAGINFNIVDGEFSLHSPRNIKLSGNFAGYPNFQVLYAPEPISEFNTLYWTQSIDTDGATRVYLAPAGVPNAIATRIEVSTTGGGPTFTDWAQPGNSAGFIFPAWAIGNTYNVTWFFQVVM